MYHSTWNTVGAARNCMPNLAYSQFGMMMDCFQRALLQQLTDFSDAGITEMFEPADGEQAAFQRVVSQFEGSFGSDVPPPVTESGPQLTSDGLRDSDFSKPRTHDERVAELKVIQHEVEQCNACKVLADNRTQTVFGVGNPCAELCFFGEAPGADEDREGEPFVGKAGQLLDRIIAACQMERSDVYILNTVKCRPPGNRNPEPDERDRCWHFAERQFDLIQPKVIVCLGSVAAQTLLRTTESVGRLRQRFHRYRSSKVVVTYHPAYLLRTPSAKRYVWEDMKMAMRELGVQL